MLLLEESNGDQWKRSNQLMDHQEGTYRKVTSSNMSCLEARAGFFTLVMKGFFYPYDL